ncbi:MAG: potassium transporter Trk [Microbacterium sp.]
MADQAQTPDEPDAAASAPRITDRRETVRVRRAPKFSVFLLLGAALGIIVALILTFAFQGTDETSPNTGLIYTDGQVFGFLALICITVGVALGGIVALLFDRYSSRHAREVTIDHEQSRRD